MHEPSARRYVPSPGHRRHFKVDLNGDVPLAKGTPLLVFEDHLDQVDPASGSGATLADSLATNVTVDTAAPATTGIWWYVVGGVLALGLVALLIARRRSRRRRADPIPMEARIT